MERRRSYRFFSVERLLKIGAPMVILGGIPEINDLPSASWAAVLRRPVAIGETADRVAALTSS